MASAIQNRINRDSGVARNANGAGRGGRLVTQRRDSQNRPGARGRYGPRATAYLNSGSQQIGTRSQRSYDIRSAFRQQAINYNRDNMEAIRAGRTSAMYVNSSG